MVGGFPLHSHNRLAINIAATRRIYVNGIVAQGFTGNHLLELFCYTVKNFTGNRGVFCLQFHGFPHMKWMTLEAPLFTPRLGASNFVTVLLASLVPQLSWIQHSPEEVNGFYNCVWEHLRNYWHGKKNMAIPECEKWDVRKEICSMVWVIWLVLEKEIMDGSKINEIWT